MAAAGDWHPDDCQCSAWCRGDYTVVGQPTTNDTNGGGR
jgi:hypothetical protein